MGSGGDTLPCPRASEGGVPNSGSRSRPTADGGRANESLCPEIMCFQPPVRCQRGSAGCFRSLGSSPDEDERRRRQQQQEPPSAKLKPELCQPESRAPMEALEWDALRNGSLLPTLSPAVPPYVKLGLTVAYTVFYSLLFLFIYIQLWLVLHYRHKRFSYQTVFLFLCLLWASLRTVLFSFYFKDFVAANSLSPFAFWLLYCFPVCLQFFTLTLMNLYFTQVIFKAKSKYSPELLKYRLPLYLVSFVVSLLFLLVNLTCAVLVKLENSERRIIVLVRVAINDTLFVLCAISLSVCLYKISKMTLANIYLESKGSSVCQLTTIGATVILLYTSRACYNLVILSFSQNKAMNSFDYDWYNVSDQADLKCQLGDAGYIVFGIILFVWELLPTSLVVFFFRVRNPTKDLTNPGIVPTHAFNPRTYFFDNPRRYDSDDDLAWSISPHSIYGSFSPESYDWGYLNNSLMVQVGSLQHDFISDSQQRSPI